jgi:hypothetical protein
VRSHNFDQNIDFYFNYYKFALFSGILLGSVKMSPEELKNHIISVNEEQLSDTILQQIIRYMPPHDQLIRLEESRSQIDDLHEAEKFALTVKLIFY